MLGSHLTYLIGKTWPSRPPNLKFYYKNFLNTLWSNFEKNEKEYYHTCEMYMCKSCEMYMCKSIVYTLSCQRLVCVSILYCVIFVSNIPPLFLVRKRESRWHFIFLLLKSIVEARAAYFSNSLPMLYHRAIWRINIK